MLGTQEQRTEGMKRQAQELIDQAYQRGYKKAEEDYHIQSEKDRDSSYQCGYEYGIEQGRNEAWDAARNIAGDWLSGSEMTKKLFDCSYAYAVFKNFSASEAIEKLKAWEQNKEQQKDDKIRVGDEVYLLDIMRPKIVTNIYDYNGIVYAVYICDTGNWGADPITNLKKTGKHYDEIAQVLAKIKEGI